MPVYFYFRFYFAFRRSVGRTVAWLDDDCYLYSGVNTTSIEIGFAIESLFASLRLCRRHLFASGAAV